MNGMIAAFRQVEVKARCRGGTRSRQLRTWSGDICYCTSDGSSGFERKKSNLPECVQAAINSAPFDLSKQTVGAMPLRNSNKPCARCRIRRHRITNELIHPNIIGAVLDVCEEACGLR